MRVNIAKIVTYGAIATLLGFVVAGSLAQDKTPTGPAHPDALAAQLAERPIVVAMFYSGFCGACQVLDPKIDAVKSEYADRPVTFITFDKTFSMLGGRDQRAQLAADHGMTALWDANKGRQGFALVVDPNTGQALDMLTMRNTKADIRASLDRALGT